MPGHQLTFGPLGPVLPESHVHAVEEESFDVVDLECPCCGKKLFVYYRVLQENEWANERQKEGNEK